MVKAYQVNSKGEKVGASTSFSDDSWEKMKKAFGNKLRWKEETKEGKAEEKKSKPKNGSGEKK